MLEKNEIEQRAKVVYEARYGQGSWDAASTVVKANETDAVCRIAAYAELYPPDIALRDQYSGPVELNGRMTLTLAP